MQRHFKLIESAMSSLYDDIMYSLFKNKIDEYMLENFGRKFPEGLGGVFGIDTEEELYEEFITLGFEYIRAWGRLRVIVGEYHIERCVYWFLEKYMLSPKLKPQEAVVRQSSSFVEKEHVINTVTVVECEEVGLEEVDSVICVDSVASLDIILQEKSEITSVESVCVKLEGSNRIEVENEIFNKDKKVYHLGTDMDDVYIYKDGYGWKFKFVGESRNEAKEYFRALGLDIGVKGNRVKDIFRTYINLPLCDPQKPLFFSYSWIMDEYREACTDSRLKERFVIKYSRILSMRPCYVRGDPAEYLLLESDGSDVMTVDDFMVLPVVVNRILSHFAYDSLDGNLNDLFDYIDSVIFLEGNCSRLYEYLLNSLGVLSVIGYKEIKIEFFFKILGGSRYKMTDIEKDIYKSQIFKGNIGSYELYNRRLLEMCSLTGGVYKYDTRYSKMKSSEEITFKQRNRKGKVKFGIGTLDKTSFDLILAKKGHGFDRELFYYDVIKEASCCARHSTLVDESESFVHMMCKREILTLCNDNVLSGDWFIEYVFPSGPDLSLVNKTVFLLSCGVYVQYLISIDDSLGSFGFLALGRRVHQGMSDYWGRCCLEFKCE